ncbi:aminoglycoside 6-adenylyltransferase [Kallipyga massiliensis]|uniref:aminoglycoside 6-adenylyltransferase n=1 Tax=Kallipyga massiliensis TaxID=1472764 RepID=UPI0004B1A870|nr:aminoglycoside 6-adenylyltransferase [Kallipyga massiliensis]
MDGQERSDTRKPEEIVECLEEQFGRMDQVRLLVRAGRWINPAATADKDSPYSWWLGSRDLDFWRDFSFENLLDQPLIQSSLLSFDPPRFRLLLPNRMRLDFLVDRPEAVVKRMEADSLTEVRVDKDDRVIEDRVTSDISHRTKSPDMEELKLHPGNFFREMSDMAFYLQGKELIPAQQALDRGRKILLRLAETAVARSNGYSINLGEDLRNVGAYMDPNQYESLQRTYSNTDMDNLWDALFQSCILFRKVGLAIDQGTSFNYPRKLDVEMMKMFRQIWKEML